MFTPQTAIRTAGSCGRPGRRTGKSQPATFNSHRIATAKVKMQNKSVDPALRAALVGQHNNPGRPCSIHIGPLPKTQECKTSPYRPLLWPPSVENPNNPCTAPSIRTGPLPQRQICKTNLLEQVTLWPLGGEPEEPRPASINPRNIASTKVRMANKPLDESTALYRGREPSERRFTLTCTQCTIGWSSLTRFNAQIYAVGC